MSILNQETMNIQNPALGAVLLWRFTSGYEEGSNDNSPTPLPLLFIVLPIMFHQETAEFVLSTHRSSGLRIFVGKFTASENTKSDLLIAIHERSLILKNLAMNSLKLAITSSLISIDPAKGVAIPLSSTPPKAGIPQPVQRMLNGAEKLGFWCSKLSLHEVSVILKVAF